MHLIANAKNLQPNILRMLGVAVCVAVGVAVGLAIGLAVGLSVALAK